MVFERVVEGLQRVVSGSRRCFLGGIEFVVAAKKLIKVDFDLHFSINKYGRLIISDINIKV